MSEADRNALVLGSLDAVRRAVVCHLPRKLYASHHEDIEQEALLFVLERADEQDPERGEFAGWAHVVARWVVRGYLRDLGRLRARSGPLHEDTATGLPPWAARDIPTARDWQRILGRHRRRRERKRRELLPRPRRRKPPKRATPAPRHPTRIVRRLAWVRIPGRERRVLQEVEVPA